MAGISAARSRPHRFHQGRDGHNGTDGLDGNHIAEPSSRSATPPSSNATRVWSYRDVQRKARPSANHAHSRERQHE